jgi:phosphoribosylformylglycinamidine cyclo-ligase
VEPRPAYRRAGVDVSRGESAVERIRPWAERTYGPDVLGSLGGFAGAFRLPLAAYREPVLLAGCDGVGTKLAVAEATGDFTGIGQDLVAMCVNDVAAAGGRPLFFLDYIATGRLDPARVEVVVAGMAMALEAVGAALLGGEMAEMPGFYAPGRMDLAGFAVGLCERDALLGPERVRAGDLLVGLASSGLHANGFSLVRDLVESRGLDYGQAIDGVGPLGRALLTPTRLYVRALEAMAAAGGLRAAAHITGGGWQGNVSRVVPAGLTAQVVPGSWTVPPIFAQLASWGGLGRDEMLATFNMGIGLVAVVDPAALATQTAALSALGETPLVVGSVMAGGAGGAVFTDRVG